MNLILFSDHPYDEQRINAMWRLICVVRQSQDIPQIWKLTDPYLSAIADFLRSPSIDDLFQISFLDASIDQTSHADSLICIHATYPLKIAEAIMEPKNE